MRAFSLIEVMVVVAILGILAAVAAPSLLIEVQKANLQASSDIVAAFIVRAQNEAMVSRRCVRVRVTGLRQLTADRLNTFDCDNEPLNASRIAGGAPNAANLFLPVGVLNLEATAVTVALSQVPSDSLGGAPGGTQDELRFRPSGRVFSNDGDFNDDDAIFDITHTQLPSAGNANRQQILVNSNGLLCVFKRARTMPPAASGAPNFDCPP